MKILLVGDAHFRTKTPENRRETDFKAVCLNKLRQIQEIAGREDCYVILQAGDFFDSPSVSDELVADVIEILREHESWWGVIHGQHDLAYHSESARLRSKLRVMEAAGAVRLLGPKAVEMNGCKLYGSNFGSTPPKPRGPGFHILVSHAMVGDKPLWPGHDLTGPEAYARRHPGFGLYLLGDYHYPWAAHSGDSVLINCGTLLRKTVAERELELKPKVVVFDTESGLFHDVFLDVASVEEAFYLSEVVKEKPRDPAVLEALVAKLRKAGKIGVNFSENLMRYCEVENVPAPVKSRILAALPQV